MLVRGPKDKERAMSEALKNSIAFVGIDIGHAARWKHGLRIWRHV
jgi:hypothetical protein